MHLTVIPLVLNYGASRVTASLLEVNAGTLVGRTTSEMDSIV